MINLFFILTIDQGLSLDFSEIPSSSSPHIPRKRKASLHYFNPPTKTNFWCNFPDTSAPDGGGTAWLRQPSLFPVLIFYNNWHPKRLNRFIHASRGFQHEHGLLEHFPSRGISWHFLLPRSSSEIAFYQRARRPNHPLFLPRSTSIP